METIIIISAILIVLGIVGSIIPALPGPILSFIGILLLFWDKGSNMIPISQLVVFGIFMVILTLLDYVAPILGTMLGANFGNTTKKGLYGAIAGSLIGLAVFFPIGIFIGAFIGAIAGEYFSGKKMVEALGAGLGVFLGTVIVMIMQTIYSVTAAVYFFMKVS